MEFWRRAINPWGQEVLIGVAWDLLWASVIAGVAFVIGHAVYARWLAPSDTKQAPAGEAGAGVPDRIERHSLASRLFHWLMSVAMFVLLITAFLPVVGIRFPWVTIHWIAGVALLLTVLYHVIHAVFWQDLRSMSISRREIAEGTRGVARFFARARSPADRAGKYPLDHKLYHHATTLVTIAAVATGLLMMFRVDTPLWVRNPYLLSDATWGFVYVVHGLSGVALVTMVIAHVYFAVRPEKRWMTRSMIRGWILRKEYLSHHDPDRWAVTPGHQAPAVTVGAPGSHGKQHVG